MTADLPDDKKSRFIVAAQPPHSDDELELERDIAELPLRVRWRYRIRPAILRYALNRVWPGRWSQAEIDQIHRRAHERFLALQACVDEGDPGE